MYTVTNLDMQILLYMQILAQRDESIHFRPATQETLAKTDFRSTLHAPEVAHYMRMSEKMNRTALEFLNKCQKHILRWFLAIFQHDLRVLSLTG